MAESLIIVIDSIFTVLWLAIFARVIMSWINVDPYSPVAQFLISITEPILGPVRSLMPQNMMLDLSPMVAIILLLVVQQILEVIIRGIFG